MPAVQYSSEALVQTEDLSSMSVEELQAELIRTRQAFHSAGCASVPAFSLHPACSHSATCVGPFIGVMMSMISRCMFAIAE